MTMIPVVDTSVAQAGDENLLADDERLRRERRHNPETALLWDLLDRVCDPEIPVLSIWDLGVLRDVERVGNKVTVTITPTYSGCPAMNTIAEDIEAVLAEAGYGDTRVALTLAPAWTTDWISAAGREKMRIYGIAPPVARNTVVACPQCGSENTRRVSEFGSTACKALYQCQQCLEPFDYFKCL